MANKLLEGWTPPGSPVHRAESSTPCSSNDENVPPFGFGSMLAEPPSRRERERRNYRRPESPRVDKEMKKAEGITRATKASMRFNRMMGFEEMKPVVYEGPPMMAEDFVEGFEEGLKEFGIGDGEGKTDAVDASGLVVCFERKMSVKKRKTSMTDTFKINQAKHQTHAVKPPVVALFPPVSTHAEQSFTPKMDPPDRNNFFMSLFSWQSSQPAQEDKQPLPPVGSNKRARSNTNTQDARTRLAPPARYTGTTGLAALPRSSFKRWNTGFPGNMGGLAPILYTWLTTMRSFYSRFADPQRIMDMHPLFTYAPTSPLSVPLLGLSFWDTATHPPRELHFIGPGDVARIVYAEVDTFMELQEMDVEDAEGCLSMADRHARGEGRWCFLIVEAHGQLERDDDDAAAAPFAYVAWPSTAVTRHAHCTTSLLPDERPRKARPPTLSPHVDQRLAAAVGIYAALREASSSVLPPAVPAFPGKLGTKRAAVDVRRDTLVFEKGGAIPLVDAYRTDAFVWRPWLDAVSRGQAKILMFRDAE